MLTPFYTVWFFEKTAGQKVIHEYREKTDTFIQALSIVGTRYLATKTNKVIVVYHYMGDAATREVMVIDMKGVYP